MTPAELHEAATVVDCHNDLILLVDHFDQRLKPHHFEEFWLPELRAGGVDVQVLPICLEEAFQTEGGLRRTLLLVERIHRDVALEVQFTGSLVDAMVDSLLAEDPGAAVLPYTLSGGTDNKSLSQLGIVGYGFAPLRLPADLDFAGMFHGVDERVPVDALTFGTRVLDRLLSTY